MCPICHMQISQKQRTEVRQFTVDVLRYKKNPDNGAAIAIFRRYHGSDVPRIAKSYAKSINGDCPKTKKRIVRAVSEFPNISNLVEHVLLSQRSGNSELCPGDFLPVHAITGRPLVAIY